MEPAGPGRFASPAVQRARAAEVQRLPLPFGVPSADKEELDKRDLALKGSPADKEAADAALSRAKTPGETAESDIKTGKAKLQKQAVDQFLANPPGWRAGYRPGSSPDPRQERKRHL
jgi:hypothetical protein